jgi:predicted nucleic acid-binding protein
MSTGTYFDTSALAKWYTNERQSDDVEKFLEQHGPVDISDLTVVEMRCLLSRRRREKTISPKLEREIFATFQEDIRRSFLICNPLPPDWSVGAVNLLSLVSNLPFRTLDTMHLLMAKEISSERLVTSDSLMAECAKRLDLQVIFF